MVTNSWPWDYGYTDKPRLSVIAVLLVSGMIVFTTSIFSNRFPGKNGRFDSDPILKGARAPPPHRPRRFYAPLAVVLIVVRLEMLHQVMFDFQCAVPGIEALLPLLLVFYNMIFDKKPNETEKHFGPDDMWPSTVVLLKEWLASAKTPLLVAVLVISISASSASSLSPRSTYICSPHLDGSQRIIAVQVAGVFLDAAIIVLMWRVLSWSRATRGRMRIMGGVLVASSIFTGILWVGDSYFRGPSIKSLGSFRGLDSLFLLDVLSNGVVVAVLAISSSTWTCDVGPLTPTTITTFVLATMSILGRMPLLGSYQQTSASRPLYLLSTVSIGITLFVYCIDFRSILYIRRAMLIFLLLLLVVTTSIYAVSKETRLLRHPIDELIYSSRIEADRWIQRSSISANLRTATSEYKLRSNGRDPPAKFDKWFEFASRRNSTIMDNFAQIESDILPFWGLTPTQLREGLEFVEKLPDVSVLKIVRGKAQHSISLDVSQKLILDEAVTLISEFAEHLPDMSVPINLRERPRVLVPWDDVNRLRKAGMKPSSILHQRGLNEKEEAEGVPEGIRYPEKARSEAPSDPSRPYASARDFRHLQALACPPGSRGRSGVNWNVRDLCSTCANLHASAQFVGDWHKSLDMCHQPDLFYLHDFHTTPHKSSLYQDLLPIFSRSKTSSFNDILIPLSWHGEDPKPDEKDFTSDKLNDLFWQGEPSTTRLTHRSLHGGQSHRLLHLANNATVTERTSVMSTSDGDKNYAWEQTNNRFNISLVAPAKCEDATCQLSIHEFGAQSHGGEPHDHKFVMLLDGADGPSPKVLPMLRSKSLPFISTIFTEWHTERLRPWVHFVPVDLRFQGLHSTLAYFVGLPGKPVDDDDAHTGDDNDGHGPDEKRTGGDMKPRTEDARWIAEQGRKWAEKAMRKEDVQIYWFRLLLEWGRVIDENRDEKKFIWKEKS